jgi:hypothetical protein
MTERPSTPPAWAEALVALLTPARGRDTIVGDLLEEYSEQSAHRGTVAADWWYARQVLGFIRQAALVPGLALAMNLTGRMLIDIVAPRDNVASRAAMTTYVAILIFTLAGFRITYRTRRTGSAALVAVVATAIATVAHVAAAFLASLVVSLRLASDAATLRAVSEGFDVPVIPLLVIGTLAASLGGWSGRMLVTRAPGSRWSLRA